MYRHTRSMGGRPKRKTIRRRSGGKIYKKYGRTIPMPPPTSSKSRKTMRRR